MKIQLSNIELGLNAINDYHYFKPTLSLVTSFTNALKNFNPTVFDIWGDTVNEASRMDSTGTAGCIQVSNKTAAVKT